MIKRRIRTHTSDSSGGRVMQIGTAVTLSMIATIAAMIYLYRMVLPKKLDGKFENKYLQWLHNYFHVKKLYIEDIVKFVFILGTVYCICYGIFVMFSVSTNFYDETTSNFGIGLMVLITGPIILRFIYEALMLRILGVRNLMDINNKIDKLLQEKEKSYKSADDTIKTAVDEEKNN